RPESPAGGGSPRRARPRRPRRRAGRGGPPPPPSRRLPSRRARLRAAARGAPVRARRRGGLRTPPPPTGRSSAGGSPRADRRTGVLPRDPHRVVGQIGDAVELRLELDALALLLAVVGRTRNGQRGTVEEHPPREESRQECPIPGPQPPRG